MTKEHPALCDRVRMAALARLDGEPADLTQAEIGAHVAGCLACQAVMDGLTTIHADLGRVDYEHLDVDLWPALERRVAGGVTRRLQRERRAILGLAAVLVAWRLAQLLLDVPAPVVNSVVPLALIVVVLLRLTGDPFALQLSSHQFQEKGAS